MNNHDKFIRAIHEKRVLQVKVNSFEKGIISRKCIPFDYGPSRKYNDKQNRYHFYDLDSPDGPHNLPILPRQLIDIDILEETFNPKDYVKWKPNWFVTRNWGDYS